MLQRAITGIFFVAALVFGYAYNQLIAWFLTCLISILGFSELRKVVKSQTDYQIHFLWLLAPIFAGLSLCPILSDSLRFLYLTSLVVVTPVLMIVELFRKTDYAIQNMAIGLFTVVYTSLMYFLLASGTIDNEYQGSVIIGVFILIWSNDTFAYLSGKYFGKNKLFERISPKKTWEGSIGGAISSIGISFIIAQQVGVLNYWQWGVIAVMCVVFGSLGDLVESRIKRQLEIKDSGNILPGHGGILDRFDATLMVAPFVYFFITNFV